MLDNPWSAVGNPTSALGPSGLAPLGIHHLLLSNLTTAHRLYNRRQSVNTVSVVLAARPNSNSETARAIRYGFTENAGQWKLQDVKVQHECQRKY